MVGTDRPTSLQAAKTLQPSLNSHGLICPDLEEPGDERVFTGLLFKEREATISVQPKRIWKLRLAFIHLLWRGRASPQQLQALMGHLTWAASLRREALSIPMAG